MEPFVTTLSLMLATVANEPASDKTFETLWSSAIIYNNVSQMDCIECSLHEEIHSIIKASMRSGANCTGCHSTRQGLAEWNIK